MCFTMHVHLAFAGKWLDPTLNMIKAIPDAIDRVVLFYSISEKGEYEKTARDLTKILREMGYECESRPIKKPFKFLNIVDTIYAVYEECYEDDKDAKFSVDITNGTNLMSAAACNTAFFINSSVYYLLDRRMFPDKPLKDLLVPIPSPRIPNIRRLGDLSIKILRFIRSEERRVGKEC